MTGPADQDMAHTGDARRAFPVIAEGSYRPKAFPPCTRLPEGSPSGFSLTLPIPPSLNNATFNAGARRAPSKRAMEWKRAAALHIADAGVDAISGRYVLLMLLPVKMQGDCDNRIKPVLDLLVTLKLVPDDRHADVMAFRSPTIGDGLCRVVVQSVNPAFRSGVAVARTLLAKIGGEGEAPG
jgi:hypothetical protein